MKKRTLFVIILTLLVILPLILAPAFADNDKELAELLVDKGILTQEEVDQLKSGSDKEWTKSLRSEKWRLGGELEFEYVDTQNNPGVNNGDHIKYTTWPDGHFYVDKIILNCEASIEDNISLFTEIEFNTMKFADLKYAYVKFIGLPGNSFLKVGVDERFVTMDKVTETEPLNATSLYRDTELGMFAGGSFSEIYWRASVNNGYRLGNKEVGIDESYHLVHDDDNKQVEGGKMEYGLGVGYKSQSDSFVKMDIMLYHYLSELSSEDKGYLSGITGYVVDDEDKKDRTGIHFIAKAGSFLFMSEYTKFNDGTLERYIYYIQPSYTIYPNRKYLQSMQFIARYNNLDVNLPRLAADTRTWDRETYTLAVISDIVDHLKLKTEYNINNEETGGESVDNNEFLVQLEFKF
jgi:hypothetical protein